MIYIDKDGNRIETRDAEADPVICWAQGGGFEVRYNHKEFHERHTPAPEPTWREGTVTAEWFASEEVDKAYPCWSDGDVWNGWGMPFLTRATIDSMLADLANAGLSELVAWVDGKLMVTDPQEDEIYEVIPTTIPDCAEPLYGLGAGSWMWDAITFPDPEGDARKLALLARLLPYVSGDDESLALPEFARMVADRVEDEYR